MLITSDTMPPLLDGNGNPVRNGTLKVFKDADTQSEPLQLYDAEGDFVGTSIELDSLGRMPQPVYTSETSAWCFLYAYAPDGIPAELIRTYPLQNAPTQNALVLPQEMTVRSITVQEEIKTRDIEAQSISCDKINTDALEAKEATIESVALTTLVIGDGQAIGNAANYQISPFLAQERNAEWEAAHPIGSYAVVQVALSTSQPAVAPGELFPVFRNGTPAIIIY